MTNRATTFTCFTLVVLVMTGCAGKVHYPDYYMLSIAPTAARPPTRTTNFQQWPSSVLKRLRIYARDGSSIGKLLSRSASMTTIVGRLIPGRWLPRQ